MLVYRIVLVCYSHESVLHLGKYLAPITFFALGMYLAPIRSPYYVMYLLTIRSQHWGLLGLIKVTEYCPLCQSCHEIRVSRYVVMESLNIDTHQQWHYQGIVGLCTQCNAYGLCPLWGLRCYDLSGLERSSGNLFTIYGISSLISRVIFQYLTQKFGRFFHKKRGSAYSRGFGIQKQVQI